MFLHVQNVFYPSKWWVDGSLHKAMSVSVSMTWYVCQCLCHGEKSTTNVLELFVKCAWFLQLLGSVEGVSADENMKDVEVREHPKLGCADTAALGTDYCRVEPCFLCV